MYYNHILCILELFYVESLVCSNGHSPSVQPSRFYLVKVLSFGVLSNKVGHY